MATYRIDRLNRELLRLIAGMLRARIKNGAASSAIITHVDCSRDLSHAKVFFTLLDESRRDETARALESVRGVIRGMLGREMHIRQIPELHFIYDDSERKARSIDELIDRVIGEDRSRGSAPDRHV
ncbi:MAG: 30S ribosome-binding factor RbfA [Synergistaceae bacterium]|jgi:ribosome-binding factor A|nr:30S ribosome-binding factor RbfA [Synergistaceae bacterium]